MTPDDFDGILSDEDRQQLQKMQEEHGIQVEPAAPEDVDQNYKNLTGRDLNPDMSGNDMGEDTVSAPISEEVGQKAQEAAAPIKDQVTVDQPEQPTQQAQEQTQGQEQPDAPTAQKGNSATFSEISNTPTAQETPASEKTTEQTAEQPQGQTADAPTAQKGNSATMSEMSDKPTTQEAQPQPTPEPSRDDR